MANCTPSSRSAARRVTASSPSSRRTSSATSRVRTSAGNPVSARVPATVETKRDDITCLTDRFTDRAMSQSETRHTATFWQASRRSEEHTSELQSRGHLVCRLLLEKKKTELGKRNTLCVELIHN